MIDQEPEGEYPGKHSISFVGPSPQDIDALDYIVRWGSEKPIEIARASLPEEYPISEVVVTFEPTKWENSPHGRQDLPHWTVGYDITVQAPLREPTAFDQKKAQQVLQALQSNGTNSLFC